MVHCHTVHLALGALLIWCTLCGTGEEAEAECCLCMEAFGPADEIRLLPCRHYFHKACIDRWFGTRAHRVRSCPLCKRNPLEDYDFSVGARRARPSPAELDEILTDRQGAMELSELSSMSRASSSHDSASETASEAAASASDAAASEVAASASDAAASASADQSATAAAGAAGPAASPRRAHTRATARGARRLRLFERRL